MLSLDIGGNVWVFVPNVSCCSLDICGSLIFIIRGMWEERERRE